MKILRSARQKHNLKKVYDVTWRWKGGCQVNLPWKEDQHVLPINYNLAWKRLVSTEYNLENYGLKSEYWVGYNNFFQEWLEGVIKDVPMTGFNDNGNYHPHPYNAKTGITKFKPMFNASVHKRNSSSLKCHEKLHNMSYRIQKMPHILHQGFRVIDGRRSIKSDILPEVNNTGMKEIQVLRNLRNYWKIVYLQKKIWRETLKEGNLSWNNCDLVINNFKTIISKFSYIRELRWAHCIWEFSTLKIVKFNQMTCHYGNW